MGQKTTKTAEDWKKVLTEEQYEVCRNQGTEKPFSGQYYRCNDQGVYCCVCCGQSLFASESKYDTGCGWPSFTHPDTDEHIFIQEDFRHGMRRKEVLCSSCDAHLGHVFNDGPAPTKLRYCINSVALDLKRKP